MTIRDSFTRGMPPWLLEDIGLRFFYSVGTVLDGVNQLLREGIKARMPGVGTPDALPAIGNDRQIDRGPTESDANYANRLSSAFDTWRTMGNAYRLLDSLAAFFDPDIPTLNLVSDRSEWHKRDPDGTIHHVKQGPGYPSGANWVWDTLAAGAPPYRFWRGWVIIDAAGRWTQWHVGTDGVIVGDGHTVGSTASIEEVASVRRIVRRCKPAGANVISIIITFVNGLFDYSYDPAVETQMPQGNYGDLSQRSTDAIYWAGVSTP